MKRRKTTGTAPDPEAFLAELHAAKLANYTDMDRYREFRGVLLGSDAGKRVLFQMLTWGHMFASDFDPVPTVHAFASGERNLALKIFAALNHEPVEKPTKQNVKRTADA